MLHNARTMAQAINYAAIAPASTTAAKVVSSNFLTGRQRLKRGKAPMPKASTPVARADKHP